MNQETRSFDINWKELKINQSSIADLDILTSFQHTNATQINSFPYMAVINTYMGGGYVFRMQGEKENISNKIQLLKSNNWINEETAAIFVEFTLFNPNINLFIYCSINFELIASGSFVNSAEFYSLDILDINNIGLLSFKILINIVYMCFIVIFLIVEIRRLIKVRVKYFLDFNNYIELVIIGFLWAAFSMYIYRIYGSY